MILLIILIYFIVLILLEFFYILLSKDKKKNYIKFNNLENFKEDEINNLISTNNLIFNESNDDIYIQNYIGKFYLKTDYGFFYYLDTWNLLESNILYKLNFSGDIVPVIFFGFVKST